MSAAGPKRRSRNVCSRAAVGGLEAGKRRLAGDTMRAATNSEVKDLKRQAQDLKEVVAEQALELVSSKKA